jgi:hypothetical protein
MKLCRFTTAGSPDARIGLIVSGDAVLDLTYAGVRRVTDLVERGTWLTNSRDSDGPACRIIHSTASGC